MLAKSRVKANPLIAAFGTRQYPTPTNIHVVTPTITNGVTGRHFEDFIKNIKNGRLSEFLLRHLDLSKCVH